MSLLAICTKIANEVGVVAPTSIISNTETTAKRLLRMVEHAGDAIAERPDNGWNVMVREYTFTTSASGASYPLPSDYDYLLGETAWDRTNYWQMRGGLGPGQWQAAQSSILASDGRVRKQYRIKPNSAGTKLLNIDPIPTAAENLVFDYMSTNWIISSGVLVSTFANDGDTILFKENLVEHEAKWRFLDSLGLPYFEAKAEAADAVELAIARDGGSRQRINVGGDSLDPTLLAQTPETGFG